jgi:hypothetical protein
MWDDCLIEYSADLAAAGAIIGWVRGYIFVDAGLPMPGQTSMEAVPPDLAAQVREMADAQGWPGCRIAA